MKKLFLILMLLVLVFSFGCSEKTEINNVPNTDTSSDDSIEIENSDVLPELINENDDVEIGEMI